jgi:hypothetical protein
VSAAKHTRGPWKVRQSREVFCGNKRVCHVNAASVTPLSMRDELNVAAANARLIAAAPELLEALQMLESHCERMGFNTREEVPLLEAARAAILKATGEQA